MGVRAARGRVGCATHTPSVRKGPPPYPPPQAAEGFERAHLDFRPPLRRHRLVEEADRARPRDRATLGIVRRPLVAIGAVLGAGVDMDVAVRALLFDDLDI